VRVTRDRVVSIDYTIRLLDGDVVESTAVGGPLSYLHGRAQIVPAVEHAIDGLDQGAEVEVEVPPVDAWGEHDPEALFLVVRDAFPDEEALEPGMTFSGTGPRGPVVFSIVQVGADLVLVDANHPLAGKTVRVWVAVRAVRAATPDELVEGRPIAAPPPTLPA
jgi:FKBP-type peptidyl-prolyl cis-trans isomerase SlyD